MLHVYLTGALFADTEMKLSSIEAGTTLHHPNSEQRSSTLALFSKEKTFQHVGDNQ